MKTCRLLRCQAGFTLVQAVFVLVVLALLGVAMMRLVGVQNSTNLFALQGARAYQAARAGVEWGIAQSSSGACNGSFMVDHFSVTVTCSQQMFTEGGASYPVYKISSLAIFASYGKPDYVQRTLEAKVGFP